MRELVNMGLRANLKWFIINKADFSYKCKPVFFLFSKKDFESELIGITS